MNGARVDHYHQILPEVAKHSSETERRATEAECETDKMKKAEYMEAHLGEIFEGVISGVTAWGMYVELPNTVEGLVHISKIPGDYYYFREESYELVGDATGRTFKLGMPVKVMAVSTDKLTRTVDFVLADE